MHCQKCACTFFSTIERSLAVSAIVDSARSKANCFGRRCSGRAIRAAARLFLCVLQAYKQRQMNSEMDDSYVKGEQIADAYRGSVAVNVLDALQKYSITDPNADDESDRVTFGELRARCLSIAAFLRARGIGDGDVVCFMGQSCWQWLAVFIGGLSNASTLLGIASYGGERIKTATLLLKKFACELQTALSISSSRQSRE